LPWIFQPLRFFTFLIGLTGSASLIGAIPAENAEFSQEIATAHANEHIKGSILSPHPRKVGFAASDPATISTALRWGVL
jgi:hypothetical protein